MRAVVVAALLAVCGLAHAAKPKALIETYQAKAAGFAEQDLKRQFTPEVGAMQGWLGEAKAFLAQEEGKKLRKTLARIRVQSRLIEALLARATAESTAEAARLKATATEKTAAELEVAADALDQQLADLESQETKK